MKQILIQFAKAVAIWLGLIVFLGVIAIPLGFFSIQAYITEDKLLMGIYSPEHVGTPAAFNPLAQALIGLGIIAFLLNPLTLLAVRQWWGTRIRPWLLAIGGLILGLVLDFLLSVTPRRAIDITTESLWPDFWSFFSIAIFGLLIGYGTEFLLLKRKQRHSNTTPRS
jgi:hypothetical protein